jgi:hypothetical protein
MMCFERSAPTTPKPKRAPPPQRPQKQKISQYERDYLAALADLEKEIPSLMGGA